MLFTSWWPGSGIDTIVADAGKNIFWIFFPYLRLISFAYIVVVHDKGLVELSNRPDMSGSGDSAVSEVKTVEEILKSEGNDELKFGLLIGLIKVNQTTNKDVVNTVLHLVSEQIYLFYLQISLKYHCLQTSDISCHFWQLSWTVKSISYWFFTWETTEAA